MLFIDNKYTRWYYELIAIARARNLVTRAAAKQILGYVELHHIIPRSLSGSNSSENVVYLTANEHFVCHRMLARMLVGIDKAKMSKAIHRMTTSNKFQDRIRITGKLYDQIRREAGVAHSEMITGTQLGTNNPFYGKEHTAATKALISAKNSGRLAGIKRNPEAVERGAAKLRGKPLSATHRQAISNTWNKESRAGVNHPMFNRKHSESTSEKMKIASATRWTDEYKEEFKIRIKDRAKPPKLDCPYCNKSVDPGNYKQWHGDACKNNK